MVHAGIIQINGRRKMAIEEVFGDDRPWTVLKSSNPADSPTVMHGKY